MPALIALVGIITAVAFFALRARNAGRAAGELVDMANDVRLAARRFGFRRRADIHPVETIEDPAIAIAGIASAFLELDDLPTAEQRRALNHALAQTLDLAANDAEELAILGRWLAQECGTPDAAISRLSRKLARLGGQDQLGPLLTILNTTLTANSETLNDKQKDALEDVKRAFRIT